MGDSFSVCVFWRLFHSFRITHTGGSEPASPVGDSFQGDSSFGFVSVGVERPRGERRSEALPAYRLTFGGAPKYLFPAYFSMSPEKPTSKKGPFGPLAIKGPTSANS